MALIPDDPRQRNALLLGLLAVAVFYGFWAYWYSPRKTDVDQMTARLEQLESENNRARIMNPDQRIEHNRRFNGIDPYNT